MRIIMKNTQDIIRAKVNTYGAESRHGNEPADVLDVTIPGEACFNGTEYMLSAEVVCDPLHLLHEDYERMKWLYERHNAGVLTTDENDEFFQERARLGLRLEDMDDIAVYDECENYPALSDMIRTVMESTIAHRLTRAVLIPLSEWCGGEDIVIEPAEPSDESDHDGEREIIEDVVVES